MESSREVRILKDLRGAIEGRDVLVVEDIVDTGFTLSHVLNLLKSRNPAKLKSIALLTATAAKLIFAQIGQGLKCLTVSWAMASIMRNAIVTLAISARCGSPTIKADQGRLHHIPSASHPSWKL